MGRRTVSLLSYEAALAEIQRLDREGYTSTASWTLGQICHHLNFYYQGSLDGFGFMLPWPLRVLIGKPIFKKMLAGQKMPEGKATVPASVPKPLDPEAEASAIAKGQELLIRLRDRVEPLKPSPLFGELTIEQWRMVHLVHTGHHLGFLEPLPRG